jgi:hypothetical protein
MSKFQTVKEWWESYLHDVVPANAHPSQVEETQRAFYAGAHAIMQGVVIGVGELAEDDAEQWLQRIEAELKQFGKTRVNNPILPGGSA